MRSDLHDLEAFYASRQGQVARRLLAHQIRRVWPDVDGLDVLGIGYAGPYLGAFDGAARCISATSGRVSRFPESGACRTAVVREHELPFADGSLDRVLLIHGLETSRHPKRLMREIWRVLADGGRLLAVVPNRRGLWSLSDRTPFGHGQPYSLAQLQGTLRNHLFAPVSDRGALFLPPTGSRLLLRLAVPAERLGLGLMPRFAGVVLVEAEKQIYLGTPATVGVPAAAGRRTYVPVSGLATAARKSDEECSLPG